MHRVLTIGLLGGLALLAVGCGSEPEDRSAASTTTEATSTQPAETGSTTAVDRPGPSKLITAAEGNLVAVTLGSNDVTVLADGRELAATLGLTTGRFEDIDLSPDGTTVAFVFGGWEQDRSSFGLYEVPAEGSSPARTVVVAADGEYLDSPKYAPNGRLLTIYRGDRLLVLDESRAATGEGVPMAYPPPHVTWTPGGDGLVWLSHFERSTCCTRGEVSVDPATGQISSEPTTAPDTGAPYFDHEGQLATMPPQFTFDVDVTGRFVVASDGTPQQLLWWDLTTDHPSPRPLGLSVDLQEVPPVAW